MSPRPPLPRSVLTPASARVSPSLAALLDTLATATDSANCPGKCMHALAALICNEVVEGPGLCPNPEHKCCRPKGSAKRPAGEESAAAAFVSRERPLSCD